VTGCTTLIRGNSRVGGTIGLVNILVHFVSQNVPGPVNVQLQINNRSSPFIVHIDKVKPYLGEPPVEWVCKEVHNTVATEEPSNTYNRDPIMTTTYSAVAENSQVWNIVDVIMSNVDKEFRRIRPRR